MQAFASTWVILLLLISAHVKAEDQNAQEKKNWCWNDYAVGIAVGATAVAAAPAILSAAGFTAGGVAAGSVAAAVQSTVYGGAVGPASIFAVLQSAGAAGIGLIGKFAIFSTAGGVAKYAKSKTAPCNDKPRCESSKEN